MRAIGVTEFGGPDVLAEIDLPEPHPGPGEVRIRVHAAAVNPTDTLLRSGARRDRLADHPLPWVPGMDAAGVVDEVGEGSGWSVGDEVVALVVPSGTSGAYADQVVVPAASVVPKPAGTAFPAASTLLMNALTARLALDALAVPVEGAAAVTGAAGAFGGYTVQLARADGTRVVADAAEPDEDLVRSLGADEVVRRGDDVADRIRQVAPEGVDGLADGALLHDKVAPAIRDGGGLAVVRGWTGDPGRGITVHRIMVASAARDTAALDRLRQQAEDGILTLRVADVLPAARAADAHRRLEAGGVRGRLVLDLTA